eukprot:INCI20182.2.p1 GENE.INCI20182.2~~INCI20182.2.p1  ORF type:complete len:441 (+),score=66.24 INCI20182.2:99-1421(+)
MQGGRREIGVGEIGERGGSEELPVRTDDIQISPAADALLRRLRAGFLNVVSLPMCWLYLHPDRDSFREQKTRHIREGVSTVLAVQRTLRCKLLDRYFQVCSFFAEEEFYLIVLPLLFWNHDMVYARHLTAVVCGGLLVGNLYKDSFELPRPAAMSKEVWTPKSQAAIDSTACKDFGFPSTHSMNAVSNTVFTLLYFYYNNGPHQADIARSNTFGFQKALLCTGLWWVSLILGRLYLGVHSPTDVRGGIALGTAAAIGWYRVWPAVDAWVMHGGADGSLHTYPPFLVALTLAVVLILHPQPVPQTPTFLQNALLAGLLSGLVHGSRSCGQDSMPLAGNGWGSYAMRVILGYFAVLAGRGLLKPILHKLLSFVGIDAKAGAGKETKTKSKDANGSSKKDGQTSTSLGSVRCCGDKVRRLSLDRMDDYAWNVATISGHRSGVC